MGRDGFVGGWGLGGVVIVFEEARLLETVSCGMSGLLEKVV
jgi:hypothetical protein